MPKRSSTRPSLGLRGPPDRPRLAQPTPCGPLRHTRHSKCLVILAWTCRTESRPRATQMWARRGAGAAAHRGDDLVRCGVSEEPGKSVVGPHNLSARARAARPGHAASHAEPHTTGRRPSLHPWTPCRRGICLRWRAVAAKSVNSPALLRCRAGPRPHLLGPRGSDPTRSNKTGGKPCPLRFAVGARCGHQARLSCLRPWATSPFVCWHVSRK